MTQDEELAEIRANIAALWEACGQLNANQQSLLTNISRLSHRLVMQEAVSAAIEMDEDHGRLH